MDRLFVDGGARLAGTVRISGAKNSALKLMAASLLAPGVSSLRNVPRIQDCFTMAEVLEHLGARVTWEDGGVSVDATTLSSVEAPYELVRRMRASITVLGPLLARTGEAKVAMPGGDNIGSRPIDLHLDGLRRMGATIDAEHGFLVARADGLVGASITLDYPSVGATENLLMAAVTADGITVIDNAAREPEIADLAEFLAAMGAGSTAPGRPRSRSRASGRSRPPSTRRSPTGSRRAPGRRPRSRHEVRWCWRARGPEHLELFLEKLAEGGAEIRMTDAGLRVRQSERVRAADFVTLPYPGIATDFQPIMLAMLATASGTSIATENVFEGGSPTSTSYGGWARTSGPRATTP